MKTTFTYDHYADYAELTARLVYFSEHYPGFARLRSLGKTPEGRDLWAMEVTDLAAGISMRNRRSILTETRMPGK